MENAGVLEMSVEMREIGKILWEGGEQASNFCNWFPTLFGMIMDAVQDRAINCHLGAPLSKGPKMEVVSSACGRVPACK